MAHEWKFEFREILHVVTKENVGSSVGGMKSKDDKYGEISTGAASCHDDRTYGVIHSCHEIE
jgi:hypothetical protein